jgi:hypothetical protein
MLDLKRLQRDVFGASSQEAIIAVLQVIKRSKEAKKKRPKPRLLCLSASGDGRASLHILKMGERGFKRCVRPLPCKGGRACRSSFRRISAAFDASRCPLVSPVLRVVKTVYDDTLIMRPVVQLAFVSDGRHQLAVG